VAVLPIRDENPIHRTPVVTVLLIIACVATWLVAQAGLDGVDVVDTEIGPVRIGQELRFNLEYAAVPCEIVQQRPLSIEEITETYVRGDTAACQDAPRSPALFPGKAVLLAVVTSMFLHGGLFHLGFNMLFLWIFGNNVEDHLGHVRFLVFYLLGGVAATVGFVGSQPDGTVALVGASGAVAAVMGAYLVWFPDAPIRTLVFLLVFDIRARWFLMIWFVLQFFTSPGSGVAWVAHVAGFIFGAGLGLVARRSRHPVLVPRDRVAARWWDPTGGAGRGPYPHPGDWVSQR
jgi:membrane associated rhomboid family serine protease